MSFLKITDPAKRGSIVEEFLNRKKNIQRDYLSEKLGDIGMQQDLMKLYRPIVESQTAISKEQNALLSTIKDNSTATSNALQALPASISASLKALQSPQYPSIEAYDDNDPVEDVRKLEYGEVAWKYLHGYATTDPADKTFGIRSENQTFYIGPTPITVEDSDITVAGKTYVGTPGIWELLTRANPDKEIYDDNDRANYGEILLAADALREPNTQALKKANTELKDKREEIIIPIWKADKMKRVEKAKEARKAKAKLKTTKGKGVVVIPQDPNALAEMLSLLMASFRAGNTGARNEIVGICDELLRQNAITKEGYKNFMSQL